jgi:hypothetical protein
MCIDVADVLTVDDAIITVASATLFASIPARAAPMKRKVGWSRGRGDLD